MLTILLVITSFWAVVIWIVFQGCNINLGITEPGGEKQGRRPLGSDSAKPIKTSDVFSPRLVSLEDERTKAAHADSSSGCPSRSKEEETTQKDAPNLSQDPTCKGVNESSGNVSVKLPTSNNHSLTTTCARRSCDSHIPSKRVERRSISYSAHGRSHENADEALVASPEDRGRRSSRDRNCKTRSVSPHRRRRNSDVFVSVENSCPNDNVGDCDALCRNGDSQTRGRAPKRETPREKLLRKRRRIISQLQERDIDELLRVYFFSDCPKDEFKFATPQNIDEKILVPFVRTLKDRDRRSLSNVRKHRRDRGSHTSIEDVEDIGGGNYNNVNSINADVGAEDSTHPHHSPSISRPSSSEDVDRHYKHYEELKLLGHVQMSWRDVDSHIPSFFDLDQPRKRAWSLVLYDREKSKKGRGKLTKITSKSVEEKLFAQPSIFGTVADEKAPRDNTRRGFPQTPKGTRGGFDVDGAHPLPEWALAEDDDNSLVYEEGVLVSGCLGALVLHATPTPTYYPDAAYLFAFLLSARLFIKPHDLLQKICNLGFSQQGLINEDINTINKDELGNFVPHMVQLLGEWSETFPYDFRDERMMVGVRTMTHRCIALQPTLRRDVTQVLHNLLNKLTQLERHEETLAKLSVPLPADYLPTVPDITEVCPTALVLAQQLTHIELERLSYIGPEEFVQAFAKDNLEATYKDLKKTNNLESYVQWFNRLSYLVATQACSPVKKKHRVRVIEMWIEVARECFNIGNFNSLMGVIAGLNMSPVARLKKTWSKVQTAKFSVLEHQMDPSSNFSSYRSTLKAAMWRSAGAIDERQKIVIPFFSLLVKDLYFLNEGCANRLPNGHINFDKFWQLAKQVTEFMAWKQVSCPFQKDSQVLHYLQTTPVLSETGLAIASFEGEGPENSYERERFKTLKSNSQQQQQAPN